MAGKKAAHIGSPVSHGGNIVTGSSNVHINNMNAAITCASKVACSKHSSPVVNQGAKHVWINNQLAHRQGDGISCGAKTTDGSPNVFIGGPVSTVCGSISPPPPVCPLCEALSLGSESQNISIPTASPFPVHALTGSKILTEEPDFTMSSTMPTVWGRTYSSLNTREAGLFGRGWASPYCLHLAINQPVNDPDNTPVKLLDQQGRGIPFFALEPGETTYQPSEGQSLSRDFNGTYILKSGGISYYFISSPADTPQTVPLTRVEDRNGNFTALKYDDQGRLLFLKDKVGQQLVFSYSEESPARLASIALHRNEPHEQKQEPRVLVQYGYDAKNRLTSVTLADGQVKRQYTYHDSGPGVGLMASHTLPTGLVCTYEWAQGPDHPRVVRHGTSEGMVWLSKYVIHPSGSGETTITDALGHMRHWRWGKSYRLKSYTNATGETVALVWNDNDLPVQCVMPNGATYRYEFSAQGNLTKVTDPAGASWSYEWDEGRSLLLLRQDPEGAKTAYDYDEKGNRILTQYPNGAEEKLAYDESGNVTQHINAHDDIYHYGWDNLGRLVHYRDCSGSDYGFSYDAYGYLAEERDPLGQTTTLQHSPLGKLLNVRYPDANQHQYSWDNAGLLLSSTNPMGGVAEYSYSKYGQITTKRDSLGHTIHFHYDLKGNMIRLVNQEGEEYRMSHDAESRLVSFRGLDGMSTYVKFDSVGLPAAVTLYAGSELESTISFERDAAGRALSQHGDFGTTKYEYDKNGRLTRAARIIPQQETSSEVLLAYDSMGNVTEERTKLLRFDGSVTEKNLQHEYNLLGKRIKTILPDGAVTESILCSSGYIHQLIYALSPTDEPEVICSFERDALHRETLRTQGNLVSKRVYDSLSRLCGVHSTSSRQSRLGDMPGLSGHIPSIAKEFSYDANGNLTAVSDSWSGSQAHIYDALGRILGTKRKPPKNFYYMEGVADNAPVQKAMQALWAEESFTYDKADNTLSTGKDEGSILPRAVRPSDFGGVYFHDGQNAKHAINNRIAQLENIQIHYDARGRIIKKDDEDSGVTQTFIYNSENQLVETRRSHGGKFTKISFLYDVLGRRVAKTDGTSESLFVWDGLRLLQEETSKTTLTYFYEQGSYVPLARVDSWNPSWVRSQGKIFTPELAGIYYYHCNVPGMPEEVTDRQGKLVWRGRYSTWGRLLFEKSENSFVQNLRMQGQYEDRETGLYYNTFRYYDPDTGRFTSEDPIGLRGGLNFYRYAPNPFGWADPLGLVDLNLLEPGINVWTRDPLYNAMDKAVPPKEWADAYSVGLHGNPETLFHNGNPINFRELAALIQQQPNYKKGQKVILISCNAGNNSAETLGISIPEAQKLANRLGVPVIASTAVIEMDYETGEYRNLGEWKEFKPQMPTEHILKNILFGK